ncbi:MATE family efflux transporter [Lachnoanaerobaculum gingivalis]|uniref:MATE family efflux transporter n=1 Tax=Lachnoanaerobaculum gingivalis TaxID=2490855 RepID=UPI0024A66D25|nr:MATE family efflux transporter [Lachnoanaerobaculum gingivalis]WHE86558.1 MATE family efflux transporter [Lachnoanaerobaculum gingivalis]
MSESIKCSRDETFRERSLNGDMLALVIYTGMPLAIYQGLSQLFKIFDTIMAAHINAESVSAVAYLSQLIALLSAISGGLSVSAGIKISSAFGEGDYDMVKKRVSTVYLTAAVFAVLMLAVFIPLTIPFLKLAATPDILIKAGASYFSIEILTMAVSFINNIYIAVERSRGNTSRILWLNMLVLVSKLILTAIFVYIFNGGLHMIAIATLLSQSMLLIFTIYNSLEKKSIFSFDLKFVSFRKNVVNDMYLLSIPVVAEKIFFSLGKTLINSMSTVYGALMVGALGVSNTLGGITTSPQNGFQDGSSAIISQNFGAGKYRRVLSAFYNTAFVNTVMGFIICILTLLGLNFLSNIFAGGDINFAKMIREVYRYEAIGSLFLGVNAAVMSLLYGLGRTKITMILNISRVFVFRIPVLYFLQNFTNLKDASIGIVMMVSNVSITVMSVVVICFVIKNYKNKYLL